MITCAVTTGVCRHSYVSCVKGGKFYLNKGTTLTKLYSVEIVILTVWCNKLFSWHSIFFLGYVYLVYWNIRSLWIQWKKVNINKCNLN